ncbi:MAG TPA: hypothetical protein VH351_18025 [Bryobacteraceae bacterium]|jgi:hypothetical protein|nr:hypothetical protein [Bryobacteraceae bacterium]
MNDVLVVLVVFSGVSTMLYIIATAIRRTRSVRAVADLHAKLLDKCASNQDLAGYLESTAGRKFLESVTTERANPAGRILNAVQAGAVLTLVGVAELIVRGAGFGVDGDHSLLVSGAIALAIGVGFLVSAAISFVLCKSWGILTPSESMN